MFDTIYLIDDDPMFLQIAELTYRSLQAAQTIKTFTEAEEALEFFSHLNTPVRLNEQHIFLDLNMPFIDGWEFLEKFSRLPVSEKIRVTIVSSSTEDTDTEKAESEPLVVDYFFKPLKKALLKPRLLELKETLDRQAGDL